MQWVMMRQASWYCQRLLPGTMASTAYGSPQDAGISRWGRICGLLDSGVPSHVDSLCSPLAYAAWEYVLSVARDSDFLGGKLRIWTLGKISWFWVMETNAGTLASPPTLSPLLILLQAHWFPSYCINKLGSSASKPLLAGPFSLQSFTWLPPSLPSFFAQISPSQNLPWPCNMPLQHLPSSLSKLCSTNRLSSSMPNNLHIMFILLPASFLRI